jgi:hypothetical protein
MNETMTKKISWPAALAVIGIVILILAVIFLRGYQSKTTTKTVTSTVPTTSPISSGTANTDIQKDIDQTTIDSDNKDLQSIDNDINSLQ